MKNTRVMVVATAAALALGLSACAGSQTPGTSPTGGGGGGGAAQPAANAAATAIFNPSSEKGGTLRFGISSDWDSVDTWRESDSFAGAMRACRELCVDFRPNDSTLRVAVPAG